MLLSKQYGVYKRMREVLLKPTYNKDTIKLAPLFCPLKKTYCCILQEVCKTDKFYHHCHYETMYACEFKGKSSIGKWGGIVKCLCPPNSVNFIKEVDV